MKKRLLWRSLVLIFAVLSLSTLCTSTFFATNMDSSSVLKILEIAKHAPQTFEATQDWGNILITKKTPLYNFNNDLIAYCVDIQNADTYENAYLIIDVDQRQPAVFQYVPGSTSQYFQLKKSEKAIYAGIGKYYIDSETSFIPIQGGEAIDKSSIHINIRRKVDTLSSEHIQQNAQRRRELETGRFVQPRGVISSKNLSGVPNFQWYRGCVPTSASMILKYKYSAELSTQNSTSIISELANDMSTSSGGGTPDPNIDVGILVFLNRKDILPPTLGYRSTVLGYPRYNLPYNTMPDYKNEIDNDRPVLVGVVNSDYITSGYPNGFGNHMMVGVGYSYQSSGEVFIIVHTTATGDGDAYVNMGSTLLGDYAWFFLQPTL